MIKTILLRDHILNDRTVTWAQNIIIYFDSSFIGENISMLRILIISAYDTLAFKYNKIQRQMSSIECENCGLVFNTPSQLNNHKLKFCINSKYGNLDSLDQNFKQASKNRDISIYGKMSLAKAGKDYDFDRGEISDNKNLDDQYRKILKEIEEEKNIHNRMENEKQKAFKQMEALQKQEEELIIEDKRNNLQDIIFRRERLKREEQQLQRQLRTYDKKKNQWEKSQIKVQEKVDQPYDQGVKIGKIQFEREMLEEKKHNMELDLNNKKRDKQKLERELLKMSAADELNLSRISNKSKKQAPAKSNIVLKASEAYNQEPYNHDFNQISRNRFYQSKESSKSSNLNPNFLKGNQKIYKFSLNKEGKSEEDKLLEEIRAQEYDDLQILGKLPKNSQLYQKKLNQYKELSNKRMEIYQKAQRQRLEKMKRQYDLEKKLNMRERQNSEWVDQKRKALMLQQMNLLQGKQQQPNLDQFSIPELPTIPQFNDKPGYRPSISENLPSQKPSSNHPKSKVINSISRPNIGSVPLSGNMGLKSYPYGAQPSKKQETKDQFGYRISVLTLKNYSHKKAIKIKLILYEQFYQKQEMGLKYEFATIYHDESINPNQPYNPGFKNKLNSLGEIGYHQSFYVPKNLQNLYNKNQQEIYLMIIAAEKDEKKVTNEPKPYAWYNFKITHFGQLREGRFTFNLYSDNMIFPFPADMNKMKKRKQQELTIEVEQVLLNQQNLSGTSPNINNHNTSIDNRLQPSLTNINPSNQRLQSPDQQSFNGSKHNMNYPVKLRNINESDSKKEIDEDYFHSNEKSTEFSHCALRKPLNFDVSVAALRTLPSYIGPVKLELNFIDADNAHVLPRQQFLAEVSTDLYNPLVNFTHKIRNQTKIPPSTIVLIRMIALSALDYHVYSLGFSLIYLFLNKQGETIVNNKIGDYFMTSGYYQLPIFWGNIEPRYIHINQLLTKFSPIPCSSILIGIMQNASKISNPMPQYYEKMYNTILFQVDEDQAKLFRQQYRRQPLDTNTLISGYLQYKGIKKNYSGEEVRNYLFKTLTFSPQNTKEQLELKWMAEYQEYFGINFVIDKLALPKTESSFYYFITICLCPPANYYKNKGFDLHMIRKINFEQSKVNELIFHDNEVFYNPPYDRNTCLIIEVNRVQIFESESTQAGQNIEGYAYTVVPLFEIHEKIRAANVQKETLTMYDGDFDSNTVGQLQKNLPKFMNSINKNKKSECTLSLRILNGYYMNQFLKFQSTSNAPLYKSIQPEGMDFETALQDIAGTLSNNYNLQIS